MRDPFPIPPPAALVRLVQPLADTLGLQTLPQHAHEVVLACALYHAVYKLASPALSRRLFPRTYAALPPRARLNWDVHVVSLVQSTGINALALWVVLVGDAPARARMDWRARLWGYTGAAGLVQAFAAGYFIWDLAVTARHVRIFGWGMLAHAMCALLVFSCGFVRLLSLPSFSFFFFALPFFSLFHIPFISLYRKARVYELRKIIKEKK
jgi:hypothetical protein